MDEAIVSLEAALEELRTALESLPDELSGELETIVERTEDLIEGLRLKAGQDTAPPA